MRFVEVFLFTIECVRIYLSRTVFEEHRPDAERRVDQQNEAAKITIWHGPHFGVDAGAINQLFLKGLEKMAGMAYDID